MKKLLTSISVALLAIAICFAAGCGGATSSLSSFVSAVKDGDYSKAAEYVVGQPNLGDSGYDSDEIYEYIYKKTAGSFKYSVDEQTTSEDGTTCTVKISYSCYSATALAAKYVLAISFLGGSKEQSKSTVNDCLDEMEKSTGSLTVTLVKDEDAGWLVGAASATALIAVICL